MDMRRSLLTVFLIFLITIVHAEEDRFCPSGDANGAPTTSIANWRAGVVTQGEPVMLRVAFDGPDSSCGGAPCFAQGGATGVEVRRAGTSVCVGVPQKGKLATMFGWIPAIRWSSAGGAPQPGVLWAGVWQNEAAKITVQSIGNGQLDIKGHAIRDLGLGTGEIFGDFAIAGNPEKGIVTGSGDDACKVSVRRLGDYLVVADNGGCGGMGVSFSGMYRLRHH